MKQRLKTDLYIPQGNRRLVNFWFSCDELVGFYVWLTEVVMLAMMGHMVVLGMALGTLMVPVYWSLQTG